MIDAIYLTRVNGFISQWECTIWDTHKVIGRGWSKTWWGAVWMAYRQATRGDRP